MKKGKVYLVGAGPGDPGLITVKGVECLRRAEVVIYDRLIDQRLLAEVRPEAELIYVGKSPQSHAMSQREINELLIQKARKGKAVVRLKGGDPFVFGRGAEEAEALASAHIPFEVVPGVSAALAGPAYAGIPVSHRGLASSFAVITGHEDPAKAETSIAWEKLATGVDTLIFLMGVGNLPYIIERLIQNGRAPSTPVALIHHGTRPDQQTIVGTLESIVAQAGQSNIEPPALIIVGEVVRLRHELRWFDNRPLLGKKVMVTRAKHQAGALSRMLMERGAEPVEVPTIEIEPTLEPKELDQTMLSLSKYDWVIFTSANAVEVFLQRLHSLGFDASKFKGVKLCAIGPATAEALERHAFAPDFIPKEHTTAAIIAGFEQGKAYGRRILLPQTEGAGERLAEGLRGLGAEVKQVPIYRTIPVTEAKGVEMLLKGEIDIITFTSPSTVLGLLSLLGRDRGAVKRAQIACIGPVTAAAALRLGIKVDIVAKEHTIPGLVEAIEQEYKGGNHGGLPSTASASPSP